MTNFPDMIRNVAVVGHLHHGKTALMDMLIFETHKLMWDADNAVCKTSIPSEVDANGCFGRHGILTLTSCLVNDKYRSSHPPCLSFCRRLLENHI
jgi:hypothetical protein